ncbi:MAG: hypothetical protein RLZZ58_478 [Pseudomonadota bacterium]|jgi:hypothetical protein
MFRFAAFIRLLIIASCAGALAFAPAHAGESADRWEEVTTVTEELIDGEWVVVDGVNDTDTFAANDDETAATQRYAPLAAFADQTRAIARFGPFQVIDSATVRMVGDVDSRTPRQFATMMAAFPALKRIDMIDCPGSLDDEANLELSRMVRRAGLSTHVPAGGSVRSGAVELFLAGVKRTAANDAEFGVHSWRDEDGYEARDFAAGDPVHADYLNYYREMGMSDAQARAFYAFTNRTGFDDVHYLTRDEVARYALTN